MIITTFSHCMDAFDYYDASLYEYLTHIWLSKTNAEERIARALPQLIAHAEELVATYGDIGMDELQNLPA